MNLEIKDKFNKELPEDPNRTNTRRQVFSACFSHVIPRIPSAPKLIHFSNELAKTLGLENMLNTDEFLQVFSGAKILESTSPYAMCYGGHQFGNWAGQLGDGRAINLAEIEHNGKNWTLQLKGAGETPYSRTADGLAVLRSSIREHLCSEAMFHLGVPTTRSLSLMLSGDNVLRDVMYDGNPAYEKGAIVCRVAPSFIRFGNFQIFASRRDVESLQKLTDFTIRHFFPSIKKGKEQVIDFFRAVTDRTLEMILEWQRVGFVHGVMNTDNMSILGLTIDYGPYGWLEGYDPDWTPNTTDKQMKRYRFGHQPRVALWNLLQLANTLFALYEHPEPFKEVLEHFQARYHQAYLKMMHQKLGLEHHIDSKLIAKLEQNLQLSETDMTIFFRNLTGFSKETTLDDGADFMKNINQSFYKPDEVVGEKLEKWKDWFKQYQDLLLKENLSQEERKSKMDKVNPKYVLRNYMAQLAIDAADQGDYSMIDDFYTLLKHPYAEQKEKEKWFAKRPEWARHKVGCSMLSCSS